LGAKSVKNAPKNKTFISMEQYKYSLDKSSKKHDCPDCLEMSFVYYVDNATGKYLAPHFGRCDRETNCGYHKAPTKGKKAFNIPFLSLKSISELAYKLTDINGIVSIVPKSQILEQAKNDCWIAEWYLKTSTINYLSNESKYFNTGITEIVNVVTAKEPPTPIDPSYHSKGLVKKLFELRPTPDNLTEFLYSKFESDEVDKAKQNYLITGVNQFWKRATIFWQIDDKEQIHGGKVMLYIKSTGKRKKQPYNHINWVHKALKNDNFNLCQCLFGLHRINEDNQKTIAIVESEKTAIVMSIFIPDFIWLAAGSKQNLKLELLKPIKKRNIVLFPDKGEFENWSKKANELNQLGFKIGVSELVEQTDFENGFDLADYYFLTDE
jgi:hypothetical protein